MFLNVMYVFGIQNANSTAMVQSLFIDARKTLCKPVTNDLLLSKYNIICFYKYSSKKNYKNTKFFEMLLPV